MSTARHLRDQADQQPVRARRWPRRLLVLLVLGGAAWAVTAALARGGQHHDHDPRDEVAPAPAAGQLATGAPAAAVRVEPIVTAIEEDPSASRAMDAGSCPRPGVTSRLPPMGGAGEPERTGPCQPGGQP